MSAEFFLDTNILIYTFDAENHDKRTRARELVENAVLTGTAAISYQVVQEFLNVATQKFAKPMTSLDASRYLQCVLEPLCLIFPSMALYARTLDLQDRWRYGFYDSLIIASSLEAGCEILYSEDLQHGQKIESVTICNPFLL